MIQNRVDKIIYLVSSEYDSSVSIVFNKLERIESALGIRFKVYYDYDIKGLLGSSSVILTNEQINDLNYLYSTFRDLMDSYILEQYKAII